MPELRDDTTEDGFHEIQLSGKQLVFLFMATTVTLVFVFLVGILVGRGVDPKRGDEPIDSPTEASVPAQATETADAGAPAAEPPSPPAEDELSYHTRLQTNGAAEEAKPQPKEEEKPEPPAAQPPAKPAPEPAAAGVPTSGKPGTWVLQITALKNRANAAELVQSLISKGYPAFLENPPPGTPVIYRVRIGRYKDRPEAEQVRRRLEKEQQLTSVITR